MRVLVSIGTRPEIIKLAPVVQALRARGGFDVRVLFTAQHRDLLDGPAAFFGIAPDVDLNLMTAGQTLNGLTARLFSALDAVYADERPALVIGQGDTTTVAATAIAAFHRRIPFAHVEAGLRTGDLDNPFPEEANRRLAAVVTRLHFAPTAGAAAALHAEGVPADRVFVTGNTVVDALLATAARTDIAPPVTLVSGQPLVVVTMHRRESFGAPMRRTIGALAELARMRPDTLFVFPVHPNPEVQRAAAELPKLPNIRCIDPPAYGPFVALMKHATVALSDSGGIQEEAPSLGVPVLVLRETTERPEAINAGTARLVGTDPARIIAETLQLLDDPIERARRTAEGNPFGDGRAAARIVEHIFHRAPRS